MSTSTLRISIPSMASITNESSIHVESNIYKLKTTLAYLESAEARASMTNPQRREEIRLTTERFRRMLFLKHMMSSQ
jgi:hypothetical protein